MGPQGQARRRERRREAKIRKRTVERQDGREEFDDMLHVLRRWFPLAFPTKFRAVRPLASVVHQQLRAEFDWSADFTRAVVTKWKQREAYCHAVLQHTERIDLYGQVVPGATVGDEARKTAKLKLKEKRKFHQLNAAMSALETADSESVIPLMRIANRRRKRHEKLLQAVYDALGLRQPRQEMGPWPQPSVNRALIEREMAERRGDAAV